METARAWIRQAASITVLTGAGISAESGVPTFRGPGGLWREFRPEELATWDAFRRDPKLVWEWYQWRRAMIRSVEPNAGHRALVQLERRTPDFTLVTQNVDDLHERAGSRRLLHLHGDILVNRCVGCGRETRDEVAEAPPRCRCGALFRPGVVWFGEPLDPEVWDAAKRASRRASVLLVAGTSAQVHPAAALIPLARSCGAKVIEVNTEETVVSSGVDVSLRGSSGQVLPELMG
jgi:NAD-dependent deacetylase